MSTGHLLHLLVVDVGDIVIGVATLLASVGAGVAAHVVGVEAGIGIGIIRLLLSYIECIIYSHNVRRLK